MARHRLVNQLDLPTAAYLAGLVDGEGTVTLTRLHRNENRRLVVCIANNDLSLLRYVRDAVGAGKVTAKRIYSKRHSPSFNYQITSRQALELLRQIVIFMRTYKTGRAQLALESYVKLTPRNGRYSAETRSARLEFESNLLAMRP